MNPFDAPVNPLDFHTLDQKSWSFQDIIGQQQGRFPGALRDFISVKDPQFGAKGDGVTDDTGAITSALAVAAIAAAKVAVFMPQGNYAIGTNTLTIPTGVTLQGASRESTIISYVGTGNAIDINSISQWTLRDFRLGLGTSATIVGINIRTATANVQYGKISNVEIATGSLVGGQIGIKAVASGGNTLTDCWFEDINIASLDKPIVRTDTEGNCWKGIVIDTWGTTASTNAVDAKTHAEFFQARIATGSIAATCVAYKQQSDDNIDDLVVDITAGATALNITGTRNKITLSRTNNNTPIGTFSAGNTVLDALNAYSPRLVGSGTPIVAGDFALSAGFGATATVSSITGTDIGCQFFVNAAGAGTGANPTVTLTFKDGAWPVAPYAIATRGGGNQPTIPIQTGCNTGACVMTFLGTAAAGEVYVINLHVIGSHT